MNTLEKDFVPYEQALELKELGFDEPCFGYWGLDEYSNVILETRSVSQNGDLAKKSCNAPTFSQAFRWFREKGYRFNIVSGESVNMMYKYWFDVWLNAQFMFETDYIYNSYEEAELACLIKLIEIIEQQKRLKV